MVDEPPTGRRESVIAAFGVWIVRALGWSWRVRVSQDVQLRALRAAKAPIIFVLWHGNLLPLLYQHRNEGVTVLISEHADGEIIARAATRLGYRTVRGSTSRGAARALLRLVRTVAEGGELAITPDGPRGPAKSVAPGTVLLAQRSGAPIMPVGIRVSSAWRLKSWDSFIIPKPFARVHVAYGETMYVAKGDNRNALKEIERVAAALTDVDAQAGV